MFCICTCVSYHLISILVCLIETCCNRNSLHLTPSATYKNQAFGEDKATLFFKLHELQTCSWGASKIGRVAQRIDPKTNYLYSEFDTSIFSLTVIPILGFWKLLPTFGGCVVTASRVEMVEGGRLKMEVDYTTSRPVEGLSGLGEWIWSVKVPVGAIWKVRVMAFINVPTLLGNTHFIIGYCHCHVSFYLGIKEEVPTAAWMSDITTTIFAL